MKEMKIRLTEDLIYLERQYPKEFGHFTLPKYAREGENKTVCKKKKYKYFFICMVTMRLLGPKCSSLR